MTKRVEVHKKRMEMSFVTAGSAACASTENSLRATSAMLLWTAEASQVEAIVVRVLECFMPVVGVRGGGRRVFALGQGCTSQKRSILFGAGPKKSVLKREGRSLFLFDVGAMIPWRTCFLLGQMIGAYVIIILCKMLL